MARRAWLLSLTLLALAGCASSVPKPIQDAPQGAPSLPEVRTEPDRFVGSRVRWGGSIAEVINREDATLVQVVAKDLSGGGRPYASDRSNGRFIARFDGFIDPAVFTQGRLLTVAGTVSGSMTLPIGEYAYRFPVVEVESHYLWEPVSVDRYWRSPLWYDPWYDPWYDYPGRWYPYHYPYGLHPWYW